jgi:hypothetical protein
MDEDLLRLFANLLSALSLRYHASQMPSDIRGPFGELAYLLEMPVWGKRYRGVDSLEARKLLNQYLQLSATR